MKMIKLSNDVFFRELAKHKYEEDKAEINDIIEKCTGGFLAAYKRIFPFRFKEHRYIKSWLKRLSELEILPDMDEYIRLNAENELFAMELEILITVPGKKDGMCLRFPYIINISRLSELIKERNLEMVNMPVDHLINIVREESFKYFDMENEARKTGRDFLEDVKKDNPVILLKAGSIVLDFVLNGNHRIIQAERDGIAEMPVYIVDESFCRECALTEGYKVLYDLHMEMYKSLHGVVKQI